MPSVYLTGVDEAGGRGVDGGVKNANSQADSDGTPLRQQGRTQVSAAHCSAHLPRDQQIVEMDRKIGFRWTDESFYYPNIKEMQYQTIALAIRSLLTCRCGAVDLTHAIIVTNSISLLQIVANWPSMACGIVQYLFPFKVFFGYILSYNVPIEGNDGGRRAMRPSLVACVVIGLKS